MGLRSVSTSVCDTPKSSWTRSSGRFLVRLQTSSGTMLLQWSDTTSPRSLDIPVVTLHTFTPLSFIFITGVAPVSELPARLTKHSRVHLCLTPPTLLFCGQSNDLRVLNIHAASPIGCHSMVMGSPGFTKVNAHPYPGGRFSSGLRFPRQPTPGSYITFEV